MFSLIKTTHMLTRQMEIPAEFVQQPKDTPHKVGIRMDEDHRRL